MAHAFRAAISEFRQRVLGRREIIRIDTMLAHAATRIQEHQANGEQPRIDDFFVAAIGDRAPSEEILEGCFLRFSVSIKRKR